MVNVKRDISQLQPLLGMVPRKQLQEFVEHMLKTTLFDRETGKYSPESSLAADSAADLVEEVNWLVERLPIDPQSFSADYERQKRKEAFEACKLGDVDCAYAYLGPPENNGKRFRNLLFTPQGYARLWHTIGYYQGLIEEGDDRAVRCLTDFSQSLEWLNEYGGSCERTHQANWKMVLFDDGTWGGFTVNAYQLLNEERSKVFDDPQSLGDADKAAKYLLRSPEKEELVRFFDGTRGHYRYYGYRFNGALIAHGDDPLSKAWSMHT